MGYSVLHSSYIYIISLQVFFLEGNLLNFFLKKKNLVRSCMCKDIYVFSDPDYTQIILQNNNLNFFAFCFDMNFNKYIKFCLYIDFSKNNFT